MKFLKSVLEFFTHNWGLKLISLLLAIIIFHSNKTDKNRHQNNSARNDRPIFQQFE